MLFTLSITVNLQTRKHNTALLKLGVGEFTWISDLVQGKIAVNAVRYHKTDLLIIETEVAKTPKE